MSVKKILITGGTGFLGRHLIEHFKEQNFEIIFLGRNAEIGSELSSDNCRFYQTDLTEYQHMCLAFAQVDIVIHSAALSSAFGKKSDFDKHNIEATKNVIEACKEYDIKKLIHISTPSIYFTGNSRFNISEDDYIPDIQVNDYARTKKVAEELVLRAYHDGLDFIGLRPRGLFGEHDTSIIPKILSIANESKVPLIDRGQALVDITYVKNVVHAVDLSIHAYKKASGRFYNITNDEPLKLFTLFELLFTKLSIQVRYKHVSYKTMKCIATVMELAAKITGKEPKLTRYTAGLLGCSQTLSLDKAKSHLGYKPKYTIAQGLDRYVKWYKNNES